MADKDYPIDRILTTLNGANLAASQPRLYQAIKQLIDSTRQAQEIVNVLVNGSSSQGVINNTAGFLTDADYTNLLPNSRNLLAGDNVTFDDVVANERTINVPAGGLDTELQYNNAGIFDGLTAGVSGTYLTSAGPGVLPVFTEGLRIKVVTLDDAQIKALPTTPTNLILAPGAGLRIRPIAISYSASFSGGAYTNIDTSYADVHLLLGSDFVGYGPVNDSSAVPTLTLLSDIFGSATNRLFDQGIPPQQSSPVVGFAGYVQTIAYFNRNQQENNPLQVGMYNGSGNLTGGDVTNRLKVTSYYFIEQL